MAKIQIPDEYSPEDVQRGLKLLEMQKVQREKQKAKKNDPVFKERQTKRNMLRTARIKMQAIFCAKNNYNPSDEEVVAFMKKMK
jgi:hypothetical protein